MTPPLQFTVPGHPAPQGSLTTAHGRIYNANSATLRPWRASVTMHAVDARDRLGTPGIPFPGPVRVRITFWLRRPVSLPKRMTLPSKKPDLDKLARAVLDALTDAAVWRDDAQVVGLTLAKFYARDDRPVGAVIIVEDATEDAELAAAMIRHPAGNKRR
jgi:crossover junction endodeoxyribonuclease RusA